MKQTSAKYTVKLQNITIIALSANKWQRQTALENFVRMITRKGSERRNLAKALFSSILLLLLPL